jgi:pyruvate formate lyase activating enzyme
MAVTRSIVGASPRPLQLVLDERTVPGVLVKPAAGGQLTCLACAHGCVLAEGKRGICGVRRHERGELRVPWGYVAKKYVRPVETNTIFHVRPGANALTFGLFGCDLRCPYCHNAALSQALRDDLEGQPLDTTAEALVEEALGAGARVVCAAYNEPMISAEWVEHIFGFARGAGLATALISDGNSTPEALAYLKPVTDVFRVDLKGYAQEQYRKLGGRLAPVLDSIREAKRLGYWVEVVTLVVPGLNDDERGLGTLGDELRRIDPEIPWHLNAFVPRYRLQTTPSPSPHFLASVAGSAYARGTRYVYVGNAPGMAALAHTRCPDCQRVLIEREDYRVTVTSVAGGGCPNCGTTLPGLL